MRLFISLILLNCCIHLSWADDFKVDITTDLIAATSIDQSFSAAAPLIKPGMQDADGQISASREKTAESQTEVLKSPEEKPVHQQQPTKAGLQELPKQAPTIKPDNIYMSSPGAANKFLGVGVSVNNPDLGFVSQQTAEQAQNNINPFEQLHDEVRLMVGEDNYAKMAWTYQNVKQLDNWIYAKVSEYDLLMQDAMAIVGLNDLLRVDLVFSGLPGMNGQPSMSTQLNSRHSVSNGTVIASDHLRSSAALVSESRFYWLLNYLTILNCIYFILSIMAVVYIAKAFKFLVRQEK